MSQEEIKETKRKRRRIRYVEDVKWPWEELLEREDFPMVRVAYLYKTQWR